MRSKIVFYTVLIVFYFTTIKHVVLGQSENSDLFENASGYIESSNKKECSKWCTPNVFCKRFVYTKKIKYECQLFKGPIKSTQEFAGAWTLYVKKSAENRWPKAILKTGTYNDTRIYSPNKYYKRTATDSIQECSKLCKADKPCSASQVFAWGYNCFFYNK